MHIPPTSSPPTATTTEEARACIARIAALGTAHDATHAGIRVRWHRFGPAQTGTPPVVLLHGGHGSWMHWLRNIEALSHQHVVWLPDMPGFLDSDQPPPADAGEDPMEPLLAALQGTLDALVGATTPIALGGFSFGGFVATRLAVRRSHIAQLALLGTAGHATIRRLRVEMHNWRAAPDRAAEVAMLHHNLMALMLHDAAALDALAFEIHDIACHGTRYRSKDTSLAGGLQAALDVLDTHGVPQWLVWGAFDVTADPRALVPQLTEGHPLRRGAIIEGAGHWVQYEAAEATNRWLLAWLQGAA
jgi:pimeloyl-ACP methyl ester carboxylesterase